jgi:hypothetical protein
MGSTAPLPTEDRFLGSTHRRHVSGKARSLHFPRQLPVATASPARVGRGRRGPHRPAPDLRPRRQRPQAGSSSTGGARRTSGRRSRRRSGEQAGRTLHPQCSGDLAREDRLWPGDRAPHQSPSLVVDQEPAVRLAAATAPAAQQPVPAPVQLVPTVCRDDHVQPAAIDRGLLRTARGPAISRPFADGTTITDHLLAAAAAAAGHGRRRPSSPSSSRRFAVIRSALETQSMPMSATTASTRTECSHSGSKSAARSR